MVNVPGAGPLEVTCKWQVFLPGHVEQSSPNLAVLDGGGASIVVGTRDTGQVVALHLSDGSSVAGWPTSTRYAVDSSPTVMPDPSAGGLDDVLVDAGNVVVGTPPTMGINNGMVLDEGPAGNVIWSHPLPDMYGAYGPTPAVYASPAVGTVTGSASPMLVAGGVSLSQYALDARSGALEPGWPVKQADTMFSTAAIGDLFNANRPVIVSGGDSTAGSGALYNWNGGLVRAQDGSGHTLWVYRSDEDVTSSPAIGNLTGAGNDVVVGHGRYWSDRQPTADAGAVTALRADGTIDWQKSLPGYTPASPALADLTGNGQLDVVEPTWTALGQSTGGAVYALNPGGGLLWGPAYQSPLPGTIAPPSNTVYGGAVTADFGEGYQDVVYASGFGWNILDGRTGQSLLPAPTTSGDNLDGEWVNWNGTVANLSMSNTPLLAPDPEGGVDVVLAGTYASANPSESPGFVAVYRIHTRDGKTDGPGSWPMFHHDPQHTGTSVRPPPPPSGTGYWMASADGGTYSYGDAHFYGSMGGAPPPAPVVGMAATPDGRGYWLVSAGGGVYSYGDARYMGSMGAFHLGAPVTGMTPTPDGGGYWMVCADGGVLTFGDAHFYGSMGGAPLGTPVVGVAAVP